MLRLPNHASALPPQTPKSTKALTARILRIAGSHTSTSSFVRSYAASLSTLSRARSGRGTSSVFFFALASASAADVRREEVGARRSFRLNFVEEWVNSYSGLCYVFSWRQGRLCLEGGSGDEGVGRFLVSRVEMKSPSWASAVGEGSAASSEAERIPSEESEDESESSSCSGLGFGFGEWWWWWWVGVKVGFAFAGGGGTSLVAVGRHWGGGTSLGRWNVTGDASLGAVRGCCIPSEVSACYWRSLQAV
jgi:hypothetical protein